MERRTEKNLPFFISVAAVLFVTAIIIIYCTSYESAKISFKTCFYFVCYSSEENAVSAAALSNSVTNMGGAGYVLEYGGEYYVTVSCYYNENDALRVQRSLLRRGLQCFVLTVEKDDYALKSGKSFKKQELYAGNLNTLYSLTELCYECANKLDTGEYNQTFAKSIISDIEKCLNGLKYSNLTNCFSEEIKRLLSECSAANAGYVYSRNLRKLQIAIADTLININLY